MSDQQEDYESQTTEQSQVYFSPTEARVIACLMEKELTVPDTYPLTLNSLTLACNQKSNRDPQIALPEGEVGHLAKALSERQLVKIEYGERAHKFEHDIRKQFGLDKRQQSLLTVMMLRAPQTLNDLKVRTARMAKFDDLDDILLTLESLNESELPLMQHLPKGPGQREDRYTHLLCGGVEATIAAAKPTFNPPASDDAIERLEQRINDLEQRLSDIEQNISS